MISEIIKAYEFAKLAHGHQKRKYTGEPYINHPLAVAGLVFAHCAPDFRVIQAALLHDVVEDTPVSSLDIHLKFGAYVGSLVDEVTDVSKHPDGGRAYRKQLDRNHLATASPEGQSIKLADLIHNTESIVEHDKKFAKTYLEEKKLLLHVLTDGEPALIHLARDIYANAMDRLGFGGDR